MLLALLNASGSGLVLSSSSALLTRGATAPASLTRCAAPLMVGSPQDEAVSEIPAQLVEWGCDAELWEGLRAAGRSNLKKSARKGDEAGARARMDALRIVVKETPKKAVPAPNAAPQSRGYVLVGELPDGFDQAAAEALIATRVDANISKDFARADALEVELLAIGVTLNNRRGHRSWKVE